MNTRQGIIIALSFAASTLITGCATHDSYPTTSGYPSSTSSTYAGYGVIESIDTVRANGGTGIGAGAVIGGVVGGVAGNQIGSGKGKTAATVAGAVGGAVVGNEIQKRTSDRGDNVYHIRVRLDRGGYATIAQRDIGDLRVGDQVRIENNVVYRY